MLELTAKQQEIISEIWETYKDDLESTELWGSSILPWDLKSKDLDVVLIAKDEQLAEKLYNIMWTWLPKAHENNIDFIINTRDVLIKQARELSFEYNKPYVITLFGNKYDYKLNKISKKSLAKKISNIEKLIKENKISPKRWYHIWITLCLIENNSTDLTEDQIEKAIILRTEGKQYKEERKAIKEKIKNKLDL